MVLGEDQRVFAGTLVLLEDQRKLSLPMAIAGLRDQKSLRGLVLMQGDEVIAFAPDGKAPQFFRVDLWGALLVSLRREWKLGLFLFGPVLGVFLVNLIFGMPAFLWWSAAGVFLLSVAIMASLVKKDIGGLQSWLCSRRQLWEQHSRP